MHLSDFQIYTACLEFHISMMSHISKGDISAVTVRERACVIVIMILYFYFFALIFGDIVAIVTELIPINFIKLNDKFHLIMQRINKDKLRKDIVARIREYYDSLWYTTRGISEEFLDELPSNIKHEIKLFEYQNSFI